VAITWRIALPDEVLAEYAGTRMGEYFTDARVMYDTQVQGAERFNETLGYQVAAGEPHVAVPAYAQATALGSTLVINDDLVPMLVEDGAPPALTSPASKSRSATWRPRQWPDTCGCGRR